MEYKTVLDLMQFYKEWKPKLAFFFYQKQQQQQKKLR